MIICALLCGIISGCSDPDVEQGGEQKEQEGNIPSGNTVSVSLTAEASFNQSHIAIATLTLSGVSKSDVTVKLGNGTVEEGKTRVPADFDRQVTISAGETTATFQIKADVMGIKEGEYQFAIKINSANGADVGEPSQALINLSYVYVPEVNLYADSQFAASREAKLTLSLAKASNKDATVTLALDSSSEAEATFPECITIPAVYPFLLPIIYMIFRFCKDNFINTSYPNNLKMLKYNLPYLFYLYLPKILAILFIPIIKSKSEGDTHKVNTITKKYHIVTIQTRKKRMFLLIFILSLLEVIQENGDLILYYYQRVGPIQWLVEKKTGLIIFVPFLCYFILKTDLFNHHILALILGFIGAFIINFCRFPLGFSALKDYPFHLLNIFFSLLLSLAFVLIKYVMTKFVMISPYLFLFYNGIFNIVCSLIYTILEYVVVENIPEFSEKEQDYHGNYFAENYVGIFTFFKGQEKEFYIYFGLIFILLFAYYILSAMTIYNFNLYLIIIVETCLPIDVDMIDYFYKKEDEVFNRENILTRVLFQCIGYIIIIISSLILNEIIILNFFGLNKNIRSNISSRSVLEVEGSFDFGKDNKDTELDESGLNDSCSVNS